MLTEKRIPIGPLIQAMRIRNWLIGGVLLILAFVGLVYGVPALTELLARGVILVVLIAVAVLVPMVFLRWL